MLRAGERDRYFRKSTSYFIISVKSAPERSAEGCEDQQLRTECWSTGMPWAFHIHSLSPSAHSHGRLPRALPLATYPSQDLILGSLTPESSLITTPRGFQEKVTLHLCDKLGLSTPPHAMRQEGDHHTEKDLEEDQGGWSLGARRGWDKMMRWTGSRWSRA